jgi:UDP-N-acetylmuramyl pentapeptide synthase
MDVIAILALALAALNFLLALSIRLAILQQKDYWRARILADRQVVLPKLFEYGYLLAALAIYFEYLSVLVLIEVFVAVGYLILMLNKKFNRPRLTLRILLNFGVIAAATVAVAVISGKLTLTFNLAAFFSLALVIISNALIRQLAFIGHRQELGRAANELSRRQLKTVGITGSYGKTSTKLFLNTILNHELKIISTPGSVNTDIGLARSLNSQFRQLGDSQLDAAVLEMDAYVIGTIGRIVSYFKLDIAMVTSINEQHLETFGGKIENTVIGNYQIFAGFKNKGTGIAVLNADNQYCQQMIRKLETEGHNPEQIFTYGELATADASVVDVSEEILPGGNRVHFNLEFSDRLGGESLEITIPVLGAFNAYNYAGAALVAKLLGVSNDTIVAAAAEVRLQDRTAHISLSQGGVELINDTFNANPQGVRANLATLRQRNAQFPAPNLIVFSGLYDLGPASAQIHAEIAPLLTMADQVLITHPDFGRELLSNIGTEDALKFSVSKDPDEIIAQIEQFLRKRGSGKPAVRILAMGGIPAKVKKYLSQI